MTSVMIPLALFVVTVLGLKWAMYVPHPPRPGVKWSSCVMTALYIFSIYVYAIILYEQGSLVAASGFAAYASGELTGKGYILFGATHPMNPQRSPTGYVTVWEEFWLGFGDVLFATMVVAVPTMIIFWMFDIDLSIWFAVFLSGMLLISKTGVASQTRYDMGIAARPVEAKFLALAKASTIAYCFTCLIAYHIAQNFLQIPFLSGVGLFYFFLGMIASIVFTTIARQVEKIMPF